MRGYLLYSAALLGVFCIMPSEISYNKYDYLTEQMIELNINPTVNPPSKFMLFIRKLSIIPLIFYRGYQYLRTKIYVISQSVKRHIIVHRKRK